ncbi:MAG: hypothetical protein QOJ84_3767 [Bradyrhizobium sp.]|jgi:hypothetical protein|nr:hypothetical protein [Bradyrhizobium sp.]
MKIIIDRAIVRLRPTDQAIIRTTPTTPFRGNTIHGPIRCEFKDNALTIKGTWRNPVEQEFDVEVPLSLSVKSFAQAIQFAMDCPRDDGASTRLPHRNRAVVQDRLLEILLPREQQLNRDVQFALSPAKSKPPEWTVVNLLPDGLEDARLHARAQANTFAKLAF